MFEALKGEEPRAFPIHELEIRQIKAERTKFLNYRATGEDPKAIAFLKRNEYALSLK